MKSGEGGLVIRRLCALAVVYLASFVFLDYASMQIERFPGVVAFFPSDGLALGLVYVCGLRLLPVVFAGYAFSTTVVHGFSDVVLMLGASLVGTGLHAGGVLLLRRLLEGDLRAGRIGDLAHYLLVVAVVAAAGAGIMTGTLLLSGDVAVGDGAAVLYTASTGLTIGILMVATPAVLAAAPLRAWLRGQPLGLGRLLERPRRHRASRDLLLLLATTALTVTIAFSDRARHLDPLYLCFLPIILLALRRGLPGAVAAVAVVDVAVVLAFYQHGLPVTALDKIQLLLVALSLTGLVLGAVVSRRETAEASARQAELLGRELEVARRIQTGVLPRPTPLPGFDVAGSLQNLSQVGGDFYDLVPAAGNGHHRDRFWLMIGDVSGHGLDAGLVMLMAQAAGQAVLRADPDAGPARVVAQINRVIYENVRVRMRRDDFVTFMALRHDGGGRFLAAGGHLPVYLVRRDGQVGTVEVPGPWCGMQADIEDQLQERELQLHEGDLLCLITDGILEARNVAGAAFGEERLLQALARARASGASDALAQVLAQVRAFQQTQEDDITAVLVKRVAAP
jgi:serine phosphatase RsbU (regulator of sigma subunit)/integral membrane sensor domain MASE1